MRSNSKELTTCSACEYTVLARQHTYTTSVIKVLSTLTRMSQGSWESLLHGHGPTSGFICAPRDVIAFWMSFKWDTLYDLCNRISIPK